jgi:hypothetical protein
VVSGNLLTFAENLKVAAFYASHAPGCVSIMNGTFPEVFVPGAGSPPNPAGVLPLSIVPCTLLTISSAKQVPLSLVSSWGAPFADVAVSPPPPPSIVGRNAGQTNRGGAAGGSSNTMTIVAVSLSGAFFLVLLGTVMWMGSGAAQAPRMLAKPRSLDVATAARPDLARARPRPLRASDPLTLPNNI